jgi:SAM-dependent methyltransferase
MPATTGETGVASTLGLIAAAYTAQFKEHGACHTGVLWLSESSHYRRFTEFLCLLESEDPVSSFSVNDLGCGYGALFEFFAQEMPGAVSRYHGYDICPDMIAAAQSYITDPRANFCVSDSASVRCDYSFASGTFNMMAKAGADDWTAYVKHALLALWENSRRGLAFNLLDAEAVSAPEPWLYYTRREEFLDFCHSRLSPHVEWQHTSGAPDYTLLVRR